MHSCRHECQSSHLTLCACVGVPKSICRIRRSCSADRVYHTTPLATRSTPENERLRGKDKRVDHGNRKRTKSGRGQEHLWHRAKLTKRRQTHLRIQDQQSGQRQLKTELTPPPRLTCSPRQRCRSSQQSCHSPYSPLPPSHHSIRQARRGVSAILPACGMSRLCPSAIAVTSVPPPPRHFPSPPPSLCCHHSVRGTCAKGSKDSAAASGAGASSRSRFTQLTRRLLLAPAIASEAPAAAGASVNMTT